MLAFRKHTRGLFCDWPAANTQKKGAIRLTAESLTPQPRYARPSKGGIERTYGGVRLIATLTD